MTGEVATRLPVEAGKVAELCRAIGLDPSEVGDLAPPTFPVVVDHHGPSIASLMEAMGYDLGRVLHGEEDIRFPNGPLRVGDRLEGTISLVGRERRDGRSGPLELVRFAVRLHRPDGTLAVEVVRTLVVLLDAQR